MNSYGKIRNITKVVCIQQKQQFLQYFLVSSYSVVSFAKPGDIAKCVNLPTLGGRRAPKPTCIAMTGSNKMVLQRVLFIKRSSDRPEHKYSNAFKGPLQNPPIFEF